MKARELSSDHIDCVVKYTVEQFDPKDKTVLNVPQMGVVRGVERVGIKILVHWKDVHRGPTLFKPDTNITVL